MVGSCPARRRRPESRRLGGATTLDSLFPDAVEAVIARLGGLLDDRDVETLRTVAPYAGRWSVARATHFGLVHGDYRLDNLMFHPDGRLWAVDWQTLSLGLPIRDVSFFLSTGLAPDERREHERDLVDAYHQRLTALGVEDYPAEECWDDYRFAMVQGPLIAVFGCAYSSTATERGDRMFAAMISRSVEAIRDLGTVGLLEALSSGGWYRARSGVGWVEAVDRRRRRPGDPAGDRDRDRAPLLRPLAGAGDGRADTGTSGAARRVARGAAVGPVAVMFVVALHVAKAARLPMQAKDSVEVEAGKGIVGDRYHGTKHRHVTVQSRESLDEAARAYGADVPSHLTRRNITVSHGVIPREPGTRLQSVTWCSKQCGSRRRASCSTTRSAPAPRKPYAGAPEPCTGSSRAGSSPSGTLSSSPRRPTPEPAGLGSNARSVFHSAASSSPP